MIKLPERIKKLLDSIRNYLNDMYFIEDDLEGPYHWFSKLPDPTYESPTQEIDRVIAENNGNLRDTINVLLAKVHQLESEISLMSDCIDRGE